VTVTNQRLGYYTVGSTVYHSKIDALIAGTQQNLHPTWHFNDAVWRSQNWLVEPETDLSILYQMRARQIRDQYDRVAVFFSGGSDSWNTVQAFFSAGCFIDEIYTVWSRKIDNKSIPDATVTDPRNIEAEFDLTTKQGLQWIQDNSPRTKITYIDVSDSVVEKLNRFDGEEWLTTTYEHLNPQFVTRWSVTREHAHRNQHDRGLRTALVYGVDKPKICIKDNKYCVYFLDKIVNCFTGNWNDPDYTNIHTEFFYWTPDLPEIVIKQSHMIRRWFESNPALKPILQWPGGSASLRQAYEVVTRSLIYPGWNINTFQCVKPGLTSQCEWDDWFFKTYKDTYVYHSWHKGIEHVEKNIDRKYLNYDFNQAVSFIGMINGHFALE